MKQLLIPFPREIAPTLENFVAGDNAEVVQALTRLVEVPAGEKMLYLWGADGSGRSHLLRAAVALAEKCAMKATYVAAGNRLSPELRAMEMVAIDDVERLDSQEQIELFYLYNALREKGAILLASGHLPPANLQLRADLVTRLGWGLVYQLHTLSDADKEKALQSHAQKLGFELPAEVLSYLLNHGRRDLPWLMQIIDSLDENSREMKRAITVPLLKNLIAERMTCV